MSFFWFFWLTPFTQEAGASSMIQIIWFHCFCTQWSFSHFSLLNVILWSENRIFSWLIWWSSSLQSLSSWSWSIIMILMIIIINLNDDPPLTWWLWWWWGDSTSASDILRRMTKLQHMVAVVSYPLICISYKQYDMYRCLHISRGLELHNHWRLCTNFFSN